MVSRELLFFFSALGAFNGILLSLYVLFYAKEKHFANRFLAALLLVLSVRIGKSVFMFFNDDISHLYIELGLIACALIGPFLFLYVRSMKRPGKLPSWEWYVHIFSILFVMLFISYKFPFNIFLELWQDLIIPSIYYLWLAYLIWTGFFLLHPLKQIFSKSIGNNQVDSWLLNVYLGNVIIWIAYKTFFYTSYIVGALSFSFILYLVVLMAILRRRNKVEEKKEKYADKKLDNSVASALISKLDRMMTEEKLYKNPKLKLGELAGQLGVLPHKLSQALNDNFGKSFPQYLNAYRIDEAKRMIHNTPHLSLEGIGQECGFNSNSTFYSTFKKLTGTTPAKYKSSEIIN